MTDTKRCPTCGLTKPFCEFHASSRRAGCRTGMPGVYIQSRCKSCQNADKAKYRERNRAFLRDRKLASGCVDCGYNTSAVALDFHHIGRKTFSLASGRAMTASVELLEREIAECVVLCANCHRIQHHGDQTV